MADPGFALSVFAVMAALAAVLFWPSKGLFARLPALGRLSERVRVEDALKHLCNYEYLELPSILESLSGQLRMRRGRVARLVTRLSALGLAEASGTGIVLTEDGRAYALRVVRTHRLWERYLSDRTAVARTGVSLIRLRPGMSARIVHLEDEPRERYRELLAEGLSPGMEVRVTEISPFRFLAEGRERVLDPVIAAAVTVEPRNDLVVPAEPPLTLAELPSGATGTVRRIAHACRGTERRRLLDLGIVPGTRIRVMLRGPGGDPTAYEIRGAVIALRREQASRIEIRMEERGGNRPDRRRRSPSGAERGPEATTRTAAHEESSDEAADAALPEAGGGGR